MSNLVNSSKWPLIQNTVVNYKTKEFIFLGNNNVKLNSDIKSNNSLLVYPNTTQIKQKTRGIPQSFKGEFRKTINEMKEAGLIVDSKSRGAHRYDW